MSKAGVRIRAIAKKELVEFVRDWRTILAILVIPLLMFPLLFILFPLLLASEAAELDAMRVDVLVQANDVPAELGSMLNNSTLTITYEPLPLLDQLSSPSGVETSLRNGTYDIVVRLQLNETIVEYAVLYLSTSEQSLEARSRTFDVLSAWEENETVRRIDAAGLDQVKRLTRCVGTAMYRRVTWPLKENKQVWLCRCSYHLYWRSGPFLLQFNLRLT